MAQNEEQDTDAQVTNSVSSLLSHFEGLRTQTPSLKPSDRSPYPIRASFDLPRPDSPWISNTDPSRGIPQTPGGAGAQQKDGESPTRSGHRRPMSMHIGSSPSLPPAVNVESPKSPPRNFFQRASSRSPERDNTPFGKVRELISAHSSRSSSTRPPSPGADSDAPSRNVGLAPNPTHSEGRSVSPTRPPPPPFNRAEKPKIPAKPLKVIQSFPVAGRLTPEPASAIGARISPFSTPPSSEGTPSPEERAPPEFPLSSRNTFIENAVPQIRDPRHMGFGAVTVPARSNTVGERKILNTSRPSKRHVSEQANHQTPLSPPHTRDARQFGFSNSSVVEEEQQQQKQQQQQQQPENPIPERTQPPLPLQTATQVRDPLNSGFPHVVAREDIPGRLPAKQTQLPQPPPPPHSQVRDPRQSGFSNASAREQRPELPTRRTIAAPPPRPSEESKNLTPRRESPQQPPPERPRQSSVPHISKPALAAPGDMRFPPPPKRSTFNGEDHVSSPTAMPKSNSLVLSQKKPGANHGSDSDDAEDTQEVTGQRTDYPDATQTNRKPPYHLSGNYEIKARSDGRVFDVCGRYFCVSGYTTRVFDMSTGEQIMGLNHGETIKITSVKFKPSSNPDEEGKRLWLGSNIGELQEVDIETTSILTTSMAHNRREVVRILRYRQDLWTLDDEGKLLVWRADETGSPSLKYSHITHKTPRGHTFSMVVRDKLWLVTGKEIRVYKPGNEAQFAPLTTPMVKQDSGDITSGTYSYEQGGRAYFGHTDGKVSIYSSANYTYIGVVKVSDYKINSLSFVSDRLWVAYKTGKIYVYDTSCTPWKVQKDWKAHDGPVFGMILDPSSFWTLSKLQVVTAGYDEVVRLWDATLEADWMEAAMQERDVQYCTFREVKAAVITWNVGASIPSLMRNDLIASAIHAEDPPEILVFGFQEVVDLEDKAITAKSILGFAKKKEAAKTEQHQSRVYREWRDYLARSIDHAVGMKCSYVEVQTSSLVGLFQCIFVKQSEHQNITNLSNTSVKCGMGGHYGNKGALITRFVLDHSSLCFVNCHLAAGQSHTSHRNNDIATILESENLPVETNRTKRNYLFVGGGDGSQILDHEICILNGDLNYRIDTIPRDTVIKMICNKELAKLMERDQLMVCRRRIAGFRLAPFTELPITFAPTYKYDIGSDHYDTSEKRRAPAWCDRLLYRGPGRIKQTEYRRHEVRVSDHRPVSGFFKIRVKKVEAEKQERVRQECLNRFQTYKKQMCEDICVRYLMEIVGLKDSEARGLISG